MGPDVDAALHDIFELNRRLRDAGERISATAGQTHSRRMVLQAVSAGATVPDIARKLGLQRQSVQRIADDLVKAGLARFEDNPRHRRSRLLAMTSSGRSALAAIQRAHEEWLERLAAGGGGDIDWARVRADLAPLGQWLQDDAAEP